MLVKQKLKEKKKKDVPKTAQQSIPFKEMYKDGICRVNEKYFTKCIQFYDINYQLAQNEDKTATFEFWCDFYNYFDSSIHIQLSCMSQYANRVEMENEIEIPLVGDEFDDIREEYSQMLKEQLSKGNNGLVRKKYVTFGLEADNIRTAKSKLERVEADIIANLKQMGVDSHSLSGYERLKLMYETFNPETQEPFIFNFDMIARTGLSSKDFIAPTSFDFRDGKYFRMGNTIGAVSYLQILAPELSDKMLADFLDMDNSVIVNLHVEPIDQAKAIKQIKLKITDLDKMKIEEQKKAVRSGYDMDVLPSDLVTYGGEAKKLLEDLQSRNERMFLVTVLVCNMSKTKQKLDNIIFQTSGVAQKYNCSLKRLDFQQEAGLMSSLPIGLNQIDIQRGLTTSATAIFVPFTTQELFQDSKEALYYGINAVSNNMIMADRKKLKNPNGLILGTPGCFTGDTRVRLSDGRTMSFEQMAEMEQGIPLVSYDMHEKKKVLSYGTDAKVMKQVKEIVEVTLDTGDVVKCTPEHWFLTADDGYVEAQDLKPGTALVPQHSVRDVMRVVLDKEIPVYDVTVDLFQNFELECGVIVHNSGKSFSAKREITNCFFMTQDDICLCDPEGEYYPLVKRLHGQVIRISPNSTDYVNPMDINLDYSDDDSPISLKADFVLSLCELIIGGKNGLEPIEKTIIDRCVRIIYRDYLQHPVPENMPILED
ncbi:MAG: VirB4-like conjugal transfer ATPase, CD1110 family, partial [Lachnospiraceae bacterium]